MSLSLINFFHLHKANKFSQCDLEVLTPIFDTNRKSTPKVGRVADSEGDADAGEDYMLMALRGEISA